MNDNKSLMDDYEARNKDKFKQPSSKPLIEKREVNKPIVKQNVQIKNSQHGTPFNFNPKQISPHGQKQIVSNVKKVLEDKPKFDYKSKRGIF